MKVPLKRLFGRLVLIVAVLPASFALAQLPESFPTCPDEGIIDPRIGWKRGYFEGFTQAPSITQGDTAKFSVSTLAAFSSPHDSTFVSSVMKIYRVKGYLRDRSGDTAVTGEIGFTATFHPLRDSVYAAIWPGDYSRYPYDYRHGCKWWGTTVSYRIPATWPSGAYYAKMYLPGHEADSSGVIPFIVKPASPGSTSKILCVMSWNTYQAYNYWGGGSLYYFVGKFGSPDRNDCGQPSIKVVSFRRPFTVNSDTALNVYYTTQLGHIDHLERAFIAWAALTNTPVEYCVDGDVNTANSTSLLANYKAVVIPGHSEYWTFTQRQNIELAPGGLKKLGGNLAFFAANNCYWRILYLPTEANVSNPDSMFCNKDANAGLWRNQTDSLGSMAESRFIGVQYVDNNNPTGDQSSVVQQGKSSHWLFRGTGLTDNSEFGVGNGGWLFLGDEYKLVSGESDMRDPVHSPSNVQILGSRIVHTMDPVHAPHYDMVADHIARSQVSYYEDTQTNSRVFAAGGMGWSTSMFGLDSTVMRTIMTNLIDHFSGKKYIGSVYRPSYTIDGGVEIDGNVDVLSGKQLTIAVNSTVTVDAADTLSITGGLSSQNGVTINGPGVLRVRSGGAFTLASNATVTLGGNLKVILESGGMSIASGATLRVGSGVVFECGSSAGISVGGRLAAIGSSGSRILFTGVTKTPGSWTGLSFSGGGPDTLKYCRIEYAQTGVTFSNNTNNLLKCDTVVNCSSKGIVTGNTSTSVPTLFVQNSRIGRNGYDGIVANHAKVHVYSTRIDSNGFTAGSSAVSISNGGYVSFDSSRVNNNEGLGIDVTGSGSRVSLSINENNYGQNTLANNQEELWVHNSATGFLGYHTTQTTCLCDGGMPSRDGGALIGISSACPPGCTEQTSTTRYGGNNNVYDALTSSGHLLRNSTSTTVNAEYTYWGTSQTNAFYGSVNTANALGGAVNTPAMAGRRNDGGIAVSSVAGDGDEREQRASKLAWLKMLKEQVFNEDSLAIDGLYALSQYAAFPEQGFTDALPLPYDAFLTAVEAIAKQKRIRNLALTLHIQHELNRGNYQTVRDMAETVLERPSLDPDLWMFVQSRKVFAAVAEGRTADAIGLFTAMESKANEIDAKGTDALREYLFGISVTSGGSSPKPDIASGSAKPQEYRLEQNYPNPFNPTTTIGYSIPKAQHVTLRVYDALGKTVATLVDAEQTEGYHVVEFDASGLASGVYFYRLTAGVFTDARKLLFLR